MDSIIGSAIVSRSLPSFISPIRLESSRFPGSAIISLLPKSVITEKLYNRDSDFSSSFIKVGRILRTERECDMILSKCSVLE